MAAQAIIMAGGEGTRLRPLTACLPKPLVPLLGEPVMGYAIRLLKTHGITDIGATLWYQPKKIRAQFGKGDRYGVHLRYYEEDAPMGTAGSIRMAMEHLKGTFLVLSGDGLTDCDLGAALNYHRSKKALATLVLKRVHVPLPYGVVLTEKDGKILQFIEKPGWSRVFSDLVNTGIYILEPEIFDHIPASGAPDFGKDIFPALVAKGLKLYGYEMAGYWCDVGDQRAYLEAQRALMQGRVNLPAASGIHPQADVAADARVEGNCLIGRGSQVASSAVIINSVLGENCVIGPGAVIENSCLWDKTTVHKKGVLQGCVLCDGAVVRQEAQISDGCALGSGASVGPQALLRPGVKVGPHLKVAPGAIVFRNVTEMDFSAPDWREQGADCGSAEDACALCAAYARVAGAKRVLAASFSGEALLTIAAGALGAAGVGVLNAGEMPLPVFRNLVRQLRLDGGVYAQDQALRFVDRRGENISSAQASAMDVSYLRREAAPSFALAVPAIRFSGGEAVYLADVLPPEDARPLWSPLAVFADNGSVLRLAQEGMKRMGCKSIRWGAAKEAAVRGQETGFLLDESGEKLIVFRDGDSITTEQTALLLLRLLYQRTGKLYDGPEVPRAAEQIAPFAPAEDSPACIRQQSLLRDGVAAMFLLCDALKKGPLDTLLEGLPETHILKREAACSLKDKGRILHTLCDRTTLPHTLGEGVCIRHEKGYVTITPDAHRSAVRVVSESGDSEFARELCDFYLSEIQKITARGN